MPDGPDHGIRLHPVSGDDDFAVLDRLNIREDMGELDWRGYRDPGHFRRRWAEDGLLGPEGGTLLVARGDDAVGVVLWRKVAAGGSYGWSIGISIFPEARGQGVGTVAQQLLVRYLFAHTPVERVQAETDVVNLAEQRALEKAGFTREGVMRRAWFTRGRHRDSVLYSVLRDEVDLDDD